MSSRFLLLMEWILLCQTIESFLHRTSIDVVTNKLSLVSVSQRRILRNKSINFSRVSNSVVPRFHPTEFFSESSSGVFADDLSLDGISVLELRRRAQELREEARLLEISLEDSKLKRYTKAATDIQRWMDKLFVQPTKNCTLPTAQSVAQVLLHERLTEDQVTLLMESLYRRRNAASIRRNQEGLPGNSSLVYENMHVNTCNQTEADLIGDYMQVLLGAAAILDQEDNNPRWSGRVSSQLQSRLNDWRRTDELNVRRYMDSEFMRSKMNSNVTISNFFRKSLEGESSVTTSGITVKGATPVASSMGSESVLKIPTWIPPSLLTAVLTSKEKLDPVDVLAIRERVLTKTRFFCTSSDSTVNAAIYRGNMRPGPGRSPLDSNERRLFSAVVFDEIQKSLDREGFSDRVQLFLLNDPDWRPSPDSRDIFAKPVVVALPKLLTPFETKLQPNRFTKLVKNLAPIITFVTSCALSVRCYALNPTVFDGLVIRRDVSVLSLCLSLPMISLFIQSIHEVAHRVVATKRGIRVGLPVLLPSSEFGTFGCVTAIKSLPPNRSALFDFSLSGPLASTIISLLFMVIGCYKTLHASHTALLNFPTVPLATLKSSFLSGSILSMMLPKVMMMPLSQPIPIHPLFVGGFFGAIVSALNTLPIFQLDGGRACTAAVGSRIGAITSSWTLLSLLSLAISGSELAWTWGAFVLLFQRRPEVTSLDDVTPVGTTRIVVWAVSLSAALLSLLPFPGGSIL